MRQAPDEAKPLRPFQGHFTAILRPLPDVQVHGFVQRGAPNSVDAARGGGGGAERRRALPRTRAAAREEEPGVRVSDIFSEAAKMCPCPASGQADRAIVIGAVARVV
eukprot:gene5173-biopygen13051